MDGNKIDSSSCASSHVFIQKNEVYKNIRSLIMLQIPKVLEHFKVLKVIFLRTLAEIV